MRKTKAHGFTLIELIVIIAILGILAVSALPRLQDQAFRQRAFHDQAIAALRYAQKAAIAQHRKVCVSVGTTSISANIATDSGDTASCNTNLAGPTGSSPFSITAPSGVSLTFSTSSFNFFALGNASAGVSLQVSGVSAGITVEQETGYVH